MAKALGLTDDQKAQIKTIQDKAKADAEKADTQEAKMTIWKAAHEQITTKVLTEEQRKKLAEMREKMKEHRDSHTKPEA